MRSCRSKCNINRGPPGGRPRRARACIAQLRSDDVYTYNNNVAIVTACVSTKLSYGVQLQLCQLAEFHEGCHSVALHGGAAAQTWSGEL